jgi:Zn-dependent alcohol dehydrogenase
VGTGGVGISAVQGARIAGARTIVAVDPLAERRAKAEEFGATHSVASVEEALPLVRELTRGVGAEAVVLAMGVLRGDMIGPASELVAKGGKLVVTAVADRRHDHQGILAGRAGRGLSGHARGQERPRRHPVLSR